ncbi:MAG: hypothetical protein WAQ28_03085 [Bacteroidia bacterium]|jgi:hypothetical protein
MHNRNKKIENFFVAYESLFNRILADENNECIDAIIDLSSSCFIESNPHIVTCGKCDELIKRTKESFIRYKNNGIKNAAIYSKEIIPLDDYHAMVKVQWHFSSSDNEVLILNIIYLLRTIQKDIKIFGYISGDEYKAMKNAEEMRASQEKELVFDL